MNIITVEGPTLEKAFNNQCNLLVDIDTIEVWKDESIATD
jgi:hypothetical protein